MSNTFPRICRLTAFFPATLELAFWLGLGLIVVFYGHLNWLPGSGRLDEGMTPPPTFTGFYLIDALIAGDTALFSNALKHLILPAIALGFVNLGVIARQIRSTMLDQLGEDYIRTARAYGLSKWTVICATRCRTR